MGGAAQQQRNPHRARASPPAGRDFAGLRQRFPCLLWCFELPTPLHFWHYIWPAGVPHVHSVEQMFDHYNWLAYPWPPRLLRAARVTAKSQKVGWHIFPGQPGGASRSLPRAGGPMWHPRQRCRIWAKLTRRKSLFLCILYWRTRSGFNNILELSFSVGFVLLVLYFISYRKIYKLFIKIEKKKEKSESLLWTPGKWLLVVLGVFLHIDGPVN